MTVDDIHSLYAYNSWANHRSLEACAALSPEQFTRNLASSFPSVRDTLVHVMLVEWLWLERWRGRSPRGYPPGEFPTLAAVRAHWQPIENDLLGFVGALSAADLERILEYRNTKGHAFGNSTSQMLQHLANHGTYHRGQVATMLRQLGATPLSTDLIVFYRDQAGLAHD